MGETKNCKNFFYFLQFFFFKGASVAGAILIISGGIALFFTDMSQGGIKYLTLCLAGFVLLALSSYFEFDVMNKKEDRSSLRTLRNKKD